MITPGLGSRRALVRTLSRSPQQTSGESRSLGHCAGSRIHSRWTETETTQDKPSRLSSNKAGCTTSQKAGITNPQKSRTEASSRKSLPARRNKGPAGDDDESCFGNPSSPPRTSPACCCLLFSAPGAVRAVLRPAALRFCCLVDCLLPSLLLLSPSRSCSVPSCSIIHRACSAARPSPGEPRSTKPRVRLLSSLYVRLLDIM